MYSPQVQNIKSFQNSQKSQIYTPQIANIKNDYVSKSQSNLFGGHTTKSMSNPSNQGLFKSMNINPNDKNSLLPNRYGNNNNKENMYGSKSKIYQKYQTHNYNVLTRDDFEIIRNSTKLIDDTTLKQRELKEKQLQRIKERQNETGVYAKIREKEQKRFKAFEKEELERIKLDQEEERIQKEMKERIIQRANNKIFQNSESVRRLKTSMLYSEVLKENEQQMAVKNEQKELHGMMESMHHQYDQDAIEREELLQQMKQDQAKIKQKEMYNMLQQQLSEKKETLIKQYDDNIKEGQQVKLKAQEEAEENQLKEKQKRLKYLENTIQLKKNQKKQQELENIRQSQDKDQEKRIEIFNKQKNDIKQMRDFRTKQKREEYNQQLEYLYHKQLNETLPKYDPVIIEKNMKSQQEQVEQKQKLQAQKKKEYLDSLKNEMDQNIQEALESKKKMEMEKRNKDLQYAQQIRDNAKKLDIMEKNEKDFHYQRRMDVKSYQMSQVEQKQKQRQDDYLKDLQKDRLISNVVNQEQKVFDKWADKYVNEWESHNPGLNMYPVKRQLQEKQSSYQI